MNQDQVKGNMKDAAGKVQEKAGEVFNSPEQEAKGIKKQVEGKTQEKWGDAKDVVDE
ncbi:MAG TPA: CsbD family protein [Noviherbaspirillum sp.]|nr:CsbD family protein [Noviherbaspirillum sp.]